MPHTLPNNYGDPPSKRNSYYRWVNKCGTTLDRTLGHVHFLTITHTHTCICQGAVRIRSGGMSAHQVVSNLQVGTQGG